MVGDDADQNTGHCHHRHPEGGLGEHGAAAQNALKGGIHAEAGDDGRGQPADQQHQQQGQHRQDGGNDGGDLHQPALAQDCTHQGADHHDGEQDVEPQEHETGDVRGGQRSVHVAVGGPHDSLDGLRLIGQQAQPQRDHGQGEGGDLLGAQIAGDALHLRHDALGVDIGAGALSAVHRGDDGGVQHPGVQILEMIAGQKPGVSTPRAARVLDPQILVQLHHF